MRHAVKYYLNKLQTIKINWILTPLLDLLETFRNAAHSDAHRKIVALKKKKKNRYLLLYDKKVFVFKTSFQEPINIYEYKGGKSKPYYNKFIAIYSNAYSILQSLSETGRHFVAPGSVSFNFYFILE